jgi:hypothetical protein
VVPTEVLEYVTKKGVKPSFSYQDVWNEEHSTAFAVAKATELDVIESMQTAVAEALREGLPFAEFQKRITPILADKGWWGRKSQVDPLTGEEKDVQLGSPARLKIIYDTNVRTARAAGQWQRIEAAKKALPYLRYRHGNPERPRPDHVAWDGRVLPVDHPWWNYAYPPNGYRCTCWVEQVSSFQAKKLGVTPDSDVDTEPIIVKNPRTGVTTTTIKGVQPTFAYNAGKNRNAGLVQAGIIKRPARGRAPGPGLPQPPAPPKPKAKKQAKATPDPRQPQPLSSDVIGDVAKSLQSSAAQAGDFSQTRSLIAQQIAQQMPTLVRAVQASSEAVIDAKATGDHNDAVHQGTGRIALSPKTGQVLQGPRPTISSDLELLRGQLSDYIGKTLTPAEHEQRSKIVDRIGELEAQLGIEQAWYKAVQVFVHEELHGHSPLRANVPLYVTEGAVIEEVTTEVLARELVPQAASRAYQGEIEDVVSAISKSLTEPMSRGDIYTALVRASVTFKSWTATSSMSKTFIEGLRVELPNADPAVLALAISELRLKKPVKE